MSLKAFHVFFIVVSIVFAAGFGVWELRVGGAGGGGWHLALGVIGLVVAAALIFYLVGFVRKLRNPRLMSLACLASLVAAHATAAVLATPCVAAACAVCFGNPKSPMALGINAGIYVLLGITGFVLTWFVAVIWTLRCRAKRWEARKQSLQVVNFSEAGAAAATDRR